MSDIQNIAINKAINLLTAAGCEYAIVTGDGERYTNGLEIVLPEDRKRGPLRHPYGAISSHYKPQINVNAEPGTVQTVQIGQFTSEEIRGGICAWLSREWGSESYITNITASGSIEVLRVI
jgi:hypothetical protein